MLTGHVPFEGESVGEVLMKHLTAEPDLSALAEPYRDLVKSAMAKDPTSRFTSVAEMVRRLPHSDGQEAVSANVGNDWKHAEAAAVAPPTGATEYEQPVSDEPIMASLQQGYRQAKTNIQQSGLHPLLKNVIGFMVVIALVATSPEWLPMFMLLGFCYLIYRAIRSVVIDPHSGSSHAVTPGMHHPTPGNMVSARKVPVKERQKGQHARRRRSSWHQHMRQYLANRSLRERLTELSGAMLWSSVVAAVTSLLICLLLFGTNRVELFAWMTITTTLACWAVMIPSKLAEGKVEDQAPLRFAQLVLGALVGLLAWSVADMLMLVLPAWNSAGIEPTSSLMHGTFIGSADQTLIEGYREGAVKPLRQVYTAYFAFLFVILAWWRQAEYSRTSRVSVWSIAWCGLVAWLLHFVWWFPQPIGLLTAAAMAFTIQLSSRWMPPSQRRALSEAEV